MFRLYTKQQIRRMDAWQMTEEIRLSPEMFVQLRQKYDAAVLSDFLALCEGDAESKDKASWWR